MKASYLAKLQQKYGVVIDDSVKPLLPSNAAGSVPWHYLANPLSRATLPGSMVGEYAVVAGLGHFCFWHNSVMAP